MITCHKSYFPFLTKYDTLPKFVTTTIVFTVSYLNKNCISGSEKADPFSTNLSSPSYREYWARLRDKLEDDEISETGYYLKEVKYPMNPTDPNKEYTVSLNLDDDDQLLVQKMNEDDDTVETAELLKDLFPDFSYVKRTKKPKKE